MCSEKGVTMKSLHGNVLYVVAVCLLSAQYVFDQLVRGTLIAVGLISTTIGVWGAIPLNPCPTAPFVIFAGWCFERSSPALHYWLRNLKYLGPILREWQDKKRISRKTKKIAITSIILSFSYTIYNAENFFLKLVLLTIAVTVSSYILTRNSE